MAPTMPRGQPIAGAESWGKQRGRIPRCASCWSVSYWARPSRFAAVARTGDHHRQRRPPPACYQHRCRLSMLSSVVFPAQLDLPDRPVASGLAPTEAPKASVTRDGSRPGPRWGRRSPDDHGQQRIATVSPSRRSAALSERSPRSSDHPDCLSDGGSQGFKSPHLRPPTAGQSVASVELAALTAYNAAAVRVAVQLRGSPETRRLGSGPPTMTTERSRRL